GVETGKGKVAAALWFRKGATSTAPSALAASSPGAPAANAAPAGRAAGSFVQHNWEHPVPIFLRSMALAGKTIFMSGPPDMIDEEYAFERMSQKDPAIFEELKAQ